MSATYLWVVLAVFLASIAQLLLKSSANAAHKNFLMEYLNVKVIAAYGLMALSMLLNIYAMSMGVKVKEVSSLEALSYFFVPLLSYVILREKTTKIQMLAIACIIAGVVVFFV